ncbi:type II glyceraldehyde-3-phosphate dehydrogenase [Methanoculleus sp. YWC-01]|uniref:Glyceraldehyde-3-phosphate dehydrogenase n=1 Tax=Methanoculleus nereidis TaxID=2735141 RepID=A0ABU3YZP7_9EURY|nr:type II glyceraldehyde-3-phosphate dehydrogenase [Methanoculleus sp. YWC-01]MDV4341815.1 type II glyceraldehyde-3-phosphate dehydrogenase [Methanoculleus sp. YWC-01]
MIKVAINGYGTIGKRVADAVAAQPDMEVIGVSKTSVSAEAYIAKERGYPLYIADLSKKPTFEKAGIEVTGDVDAMLKAADVIVDATPGGVGEKNRPIYEKLGKKAIFQGGEDHEVAGFSFNAHANYNEAEGHQFARVVSCNTTGLVRVIHAMDQAFGVERVRAVMVRRGADPDDVKKGPIDAIVLNPASIPSHHGPDLQTVLPHINIVTLAMIVPTTFMHMHSIQMDLKKETTRDEVLKVFENHSRIGLVRKTMGIKSNAQLREYTQDLGRPRTDLWENGVFEESVSILDGKEFYCFQAIHQEADVVPENIDCIRALVGTVKDPEESIRMTNEALGLVAIG